MSKKKTQIVIIHGGMTFKSKKDYVKLLKTIKVSLGKKERWSDDYLDRELGRNFEIIRPMMPLADDAKYDYWKIYFERYFSQLRDGVILIGKSLGGIFMAKYLSENKFPKKILSTYLVCPPFDNTLPGEDLLGGFKLKSDLSKLDQSSQNLYLLFSEDDDVVPVAHAQKFEQKLKKAKFKIFKSKKGHFQVSKFPEIVKMIKEDVKSKGRSKKS